ncbi:ring-1,2-phenylacetyl-CoA epoxidase subunit PaaE [Pedobacter westerhofensis]|uniref:Ring-1,2-phenylacetyl-CoA epoxidase subunit PaaE n=1 Tax=Pedobacter westerhofensis TaxID=425512 RepID=A0A521E8K6_9SPHI|nr:ferredoxin--NADP reductase [Pedobacter westerhofensis]SMO79761.1 ring-1,2-phenylacetyl-CoA epoxidase subunit PaaE [Pedobacter westerhofensis]
MTTIQFRITAISKEPGDNVFIQLAPLDGKMPYYEAGQFLTVLFVVNGKEIRRSYSICSSPDVDEPLSIAVKLVENGEISKHLHHKTAVGDLFTALAPNGLFTYHPVEEIRRTVFLFAAGVGITPVFSILKTALVKEKYTRVVLIYSNRSQSSTLFFDELNIWQQKYPERFKLIYLFSDAKRLQFARLNSFLIQELVAANLEFDQADALCYTCGPIDYMVTCRISLLAMGYCLDQIKKETYFIPDDEADDDDMTEKEVSDKNTYTVVLEYNQQTYQLEVPWYKRILQVALEHEINVPYSCRAGICSSCVATCTSGHVRMDYNEILTDQEMAQGRVLICTGHPTENNTRIVI